VLPTQRVSSKVVMAGALVAGIAAIVNLLLGRRLTHGPMTGSVKG
jgi:hypothetical protein